MTEQWITEQLHPYYRKSLHVLETLVDEQTDFQHLQIVETEYFGGTGAQASTAFIDGREVVAPQSARAAGPINQALRRIGVTRTDADDEFDTIGLGERRSMMDYEPEGPVRLRGALPSALPSAPPQQAAQNFVPMWVVMLVIAAAVGVGIMASVMR